MPMHVYKCEFRGFYSLNGDIKRTVASAIGRRTNEKKSNEIICDE